MLTPLPANQWDRAKAAHLLNRAAFGGPPEQIDALATGGMAAAITGFVDGPSPKAPVSTPAWATPQELVASRQKMREMVDRNTAAGNDASTPERRKMIGQAWRRLQQEHLIDLVAWWTARMRDAADPLEEKMTLFWHGHFATSAAKVKAAYLMWAQNQTFRAQARGNFGVLTKAMSRDPAMIQWLDLRESRPQHANENFARELMELFTLGEGHYTEKDVTESARAFTGYRIDPDNATFVFVPRQHDFTTKQFLGRSGPFHGDQIIDLILEQPACAQFIARKLWTFFAYENPSPDLVEALAATLRAHQYEVKPVLRQIFASQEFYGARAVGTQVKSPLQFIVQTSRALDADLPPTGFLVTALKQLGQMPFAPPNVKGWDGGKAWISTSTLLFRYNLAGALIAPPRFPRREAPKQSLLAMEESAPPPPPAPRRAVDLARLAPPELRTDPAALVRTLIARVYGGPSKDEQTFVDYLKATGPTINDKAVAGVLHLMMSTPQFQLC